MAQPSAGIDGILKDMTMAPTTSFCKIPRMSERMTMVGSRQGGDRAVKIGAKDRPAIGLMEGFLRAELLPGLACLGRKK